MFFLYARLKEIILQEVYLMDKRQTKTPIIDMAEGFRERKPEYFCIPSHHMGTGADGAFKDIAGDVLAYDITGNAADRRPARARGSN